MSSQTTISRRAERSEIGRRLVARLEQLQEGSLRFSLSGLRLQTTWGLFEALGIEDAAQTALRRAERNALRLYLAADDEGRADAEMVMEREWRADLGRLAMAVELRTSPDSDEGDE